MLTVSSSYNEAYDCRNWPVQLLYTTLAVQTTALVQLNAVSLAQLRVSLHRQLSVVATVAQVLQLHYFVLRVAWCSYTNCTSAV